MDLNYMIPEDYRDHYNNESLTKMEFFIVNNMELLDKMHKGEALSSEEQKLSKEYLELLKGVHKGTKASFQEIVVSMDSYSRSRVEELKKEKALNYPVYPSVPPSTPTKNNPTPPPPHYDKNNLVPVPSTPDKADPIVAFETRFYNVKTGQVEVNSAPEGEIQISQMNAGGKVKLNAKSPNFQVLDADTIRVAGQSIRFSGIDALESGQEPLASIAKKYVKDWFEANPNFELEVTAKDSKYGRTVALIRNPETGEVLNVSLVQNKMVFGYKHSLSDVPVPLANQIIEADKANYEAWVAKGKADAYNVYNYANSSTYRSANDHDKGEIITLPGGATILVNHPHDPKAMENNAKANGDNIGKTSQDTSIPWKEDRPIENTIKSPYEFMNQKASIGHLSRLYDTYYSSADVKLWLIGPTGQKVMMDLVTGIGYNYSVNSMPVYTIGSRFPVFFTRGNAIGNGSLVVPFKNVYYIKNMLQYIFDEYTPTEEERAASRAQNKTIDEMTNEEFENYELQGSGYRGVDIVDIGAIITSFDIEIRFDNSNAYHRDELKSSIILKDCKLTGETVEIASTRDGSIQHGYNFLFRNVVAGEG